MNVKFSEVLNDFLDLRDKLKGDYFDNRAIVDRTRAEYEKKDLEAQLDEMFREIHERVSYNGDE